MVTNTGQRLKQSKETERNGMERNGSGEEGLPARGLGSGAVNSVVREALPLVGGSEWRALPMSQGIISSQRNGWCKGKKVGRGLACFRNWLFLKAFVACWRTSCQLFILVKPVSYSKITAFLLPPTPH